MSAQQHGSESREWHRSMLFVPGNRPSWMVKAPSHDADGLVLDLEDAVPLDEKAEARSLVADAVERLGAGGNTVYVRVNGWGTGFMLEDLEAVVRPGLSGIFLPKLDGPEHVVALDLVLEDLERRAALPPGRISIFVSPETARGLYRYHDLCLASRRVTKAMAGTGGGGDLTTALGIRSDGAGPETSYFLSKAIGDARGAGVSQIYGGVVLDVSDTALLEKVALKARDFGCTGMVVIHPSHVEPVNRIFAPSASEVQQAIDVLTALDAAIKAGSASIQLHGQLVDYAHARVALALLRRAEDFGLPVGDYPVIEMS
jgi:citrate lyase subunit beta/citryl-CoA lyase